MWYAESASASSDPVLVGGHLSKLSIVVMSFDARSITLQVGSGNREGVLGR